MVLDKKLMEYCNYVLDDSNFNDNTPQSRRNIQQTTDTIQQSVTQMNESLEVLNTLLLPTLQERHHNTTCLRLSNANAFVQGINTAEAIIGAPQIEDTLQSTVMQVDANIRETTNFLESTKTLLGNLNMVLKGVEPYLEKPKEEVEDDRELSVNSAGFNSFGLGVETSSPKK